MLSLQLIVIFLVFCFIYTKAWKSCAEVPFCKRIRGSSSIESYTLASFSIDNTTITGKLLKNDKVLAKVTVTSLDNEIFRLVIDDIVLSKPPRHSVPEALDGTPKLATDGTVEKRSSAIILENGKAKAIIYISPFMIKIYCDNRLVPTINKKQRLVFENAAPNKSVALDINFPDVQVAYGLPLHADHLSLRSTTDKNPYRLFNVDYYAYKVDSIEALYGSVPVLYAHGTTCSSGVFWLNSAQTWVDVEVTTKHVDAYFMSETGVIDMFLLTGPTLKDAVKQYAQLTGTAPLPQYFTLAYHQSRYSYMTEDEVKDVATQFKNNGMPLDVVWLDIDYTSDKKYFTWNSTAFPNPTALQNYMAQNGKKLVAIIDPHIKNETGYFVHDAAVKNGYYVQNPNGSIYVGNCWPGPSAYLDFTNKKTFDYYAKLYETSDTFQGNAIHIWNDMNEPSVFYSNVSDEEEYEKTIPLDRVHFNNYEHRDVHNIYGLLQTTATRQGLLARPKNIARPFILTRSHFAGSQRYAAIWTGDNYATWDYLRFSFPMCITEALAGISFCGADVGGFGGIPSEELYQRWYQAAAWLPFYRGHSAVSVPRREPYRFPENVKQNVRKSLKQRYAHLPVWYTLFYEHELTGEPVIRPITYHYPREAEALNIDTELLVGSNILAAPVLTKEAHLTNLYLPGGFTEIWYRIDDNFKLYYGIGYHTLEVNIDSSPVFYRGGGIIPKKEVERFSSIETYNDPFTIYVATDILGTAKGKLYVDDYETFEYKDLRKYIYCELEFSNHKFSLTHLNTSKYNTAECITKIILINPPKIYQRARAVGETSQLKVSYNGVDKTIAVSDCRFKITESFEIQFD